VERPIIFSGDMVNAILEGRKTQTRRVVKTSDGLNTPVIKFYEFDRFKKYVSMDGIDRPRNGPWACFTGDKGGELVVKQHVQTGDVLWVREKWRYVDFSLIDDDESASVSYADCSIGPRIHYLKNGMDERIGWRSPIHMPRAAARIFLRVTDVRVERLQDITYEDAIAEGFEGIPCDHNMMGMYACTDCMNTGWLEPPEVGFYETWEKLNGKRDYGCNTNPWVWVYTFEREIGGKQ